MIPLPLLCGRPAVPTTDVRVDKSLLGTQGLHLKCYRGALCLRVAMLGMEAPPDTTQKLTQMTKETWVFMPNPNGY